MESRQLLRGLRNMIFEFAYDGVSFYETFTPIKKEISVASNLVPFGEAMSAHHGLGLSVSALEEVISEERFDLDPQKCVVLFSSGIDSTWSLLHALDRGLTPYPVEVQREPQVLKAVRGALST